MTSIDLSLAAATLLVLAAGTMRWTTASYTRDRYHVPAHKLYRLFNIVTWFLGVIWVFLAMAWAAT